jgi:hypothetical protein
VKTGREAKTFTEKCFLSVVTAAAVVATAYCFAGGVSGNDYWWHIKVGEWIWTRRAVPRTDIFSWYALPRGLKFTAHEWLAELFFYGLHRAAGEVGIFLFSFAAALAQTLLAIKVNIRRIYNNAVFSAVFFTLFAVISSMFFYGRPQIFSFFLLSAELCCLYDFIDKQRGRAVWAVPIIGLLWGNLHGGSSNLSYLLCLVFLVCGAVKLDIGKLRAERMDGGRLRALAAVTALTAAATLVNPAGVSLFAYPYVNIGDGFMQSVISEWAPPDAKRLGDVLLYFLPVSLAAGSFCITEKKIRLIDFTLLALFTLLFLRSVRFIMLFYIAASFFAFDYFPKCTVREIRGKLETTAVLLFFAAAAAAVIFSAVKAARLAESGGIVSRAVSDEAVLAVKSAAPERLFNDYNFGETLIYNDIPVFLDGRADVYAAEGILKDGISLLYLKAADEGETFDIEMMIEKYQFDSFFVDASRPLCIYLNSRPDKYRLVYSDGEAVYFEVCE